MLDLKPDLTRPASVLRPTLAPSVFARLAPLRTMPYLTRYTQGLLGVKGIVARFLEAMLRGIGQVFFQNSPVSGLCCLIGLYIADYTIASCALLATAVATAFACFCQLEATAILAGLYGYNACLCGCGVAVFAFGSNGADSRDTTLSVTTTYVGIFVTSICSVLVTAGFNKLWGKHGITALTFPFQIALWWWLLSVQNSQYATNLYGIQPSLVVTTSANSSMSSSASLQTEGLFAVAGWIFLKTTLTGIAQTFLIDNWITGICMLIGIALCSPISALWAFGGSLLGTLIALFMGVPADSLQAGLYGYNGCLAAIAVGGFFLVHKGFRVFVLAILAVLFATLVTSSTTMFFTPVGLPALTWPFTVVTWIIVLSATTMTEVLLVPVDQLSCAEDHYEKYNYNIVQAQKWREQEAAKRRRQRQAQSSLEFSITQMRVASMSVKNLPPILGGGPAAVRKMPVEGKAICEEQRIELITDASAKTPPGTATPATPKSRNAAEPQPQQKQQEQQQQEEPVGLSLSVPAISGFRVTSQTSVNNFL